MKRPERVRKLLIWKTAGFAALVGLLIPISSASMIQTTSASPIVPGLATLAAKIPTAQFWDAVLPTGNLGTMPTRMVVTFAIAVVVAGMLSVSQKHSRMLRKEDEARELRDI